MDTTSVIAAFASHGFLTIDKTLNRFDGIFGKVPRYVVDFVLSQKVDPANPVPGLQDAVSFFKQYHLEPAHKEFAKRMIRTKGTFPILGKLSVRYDQAKDTYLAHVSAIDDQNVRVVPAVLAQYDHTLLTSGAWGVMHIAFSSNGSSSPFIVTKFAPVQVTRIDEAVWNDARRQFTDDEWMDLLITTVGINPATLSARQKMLYICRLLPYVESGLHLAEVGPTETAKTYSYRELSSYAHVISGGTSTVASLFYNKTSKRLGLLGQKDVVCFDEITTPDIKLGADVVNVLKDMMNDGRFSRDTIEFTTDCSLVFVGNTRPDTMETFDSMPMSIRHDRAFIDRICGFIPGWEMPRIRPDNYATSIGLMTDYFAEVMHRLRQTSYLPTVTKYVSLPGWSQRNSRAVSRMIAGLLKLLHPNAPVDGVDPSTMSVLVNTAIGLRSSVVDYLTMLDPTSFGGTKYEYSIAGVERPKTKTKVRTKVVTNQPSTVL